MRDVTIQFLAQKLNLSRNTVSKALRGESSVSDETKMKVIKAAIQHGYKKISSKDRAQIGAAIPSDKKVVVIRNRETNEFWDLIIMGISDELRTRNITITIRYVGDEEGTSFIDDMKNNVYGVICLSIFKNEVLESLINSNIPIVFYDAPTYEQYCNFPGDSVIVSGIDSMFHITDYLIRQGRKRFCFIGDINSCVTVQQRWLGFRAAMEKHNIPIIDEYMLTEHIPNYYYFTDEAINIIKKFKTMPDAFVCCNDAIAFDVRHYLMSEKYDVPKEIAVSGFDDLQRTRKLPIISVHVENEYIGKRLVKLLMERIENPNKMNESVSIKTEVVFREST